MRTLSLLRKITMAALSLNIGLLNPAYTIAESTHKSIIKESPQAVQGEFIVKLKPGAELSAIQDLNAFYQVSSIKKVFSEMIEPKEKLAQLKNELSGLDNLHQDWYWQLDKESEEYKDYIARIEREKEGLKEKIKAEEEFIADLEERQARAGEETTVPDLDSVYLLKTNSLAGIPSIALAYEANAMVEYAEPNYIFKARWSPNDPYYDADNAWGLKIIQAEDAWDVSKGNDIVVAVVDSGVNYNHEDIKDNIWNNSRETAGDSLDNDGNGYVDDVKGWDFSGTDIEAAEIKEDNDPLDKYGHGTAIAGIIAAQGNNNKGITGVAPKARIMAVKALDNNGFGKASVLAEAIRYAADNGAEVINNSWGNEDEERRYSPSINAAIQYAQSKGCMVVSAAGNKNTDSRYYSPDNSSGIIVAAAINEDGQTRWRLSDEEGSNYGIRVDLSAPATALSLSAVNDSGYSTVGGTSVSAAYVSGVAALLLKKYPDDSRNEIKARLLSSASEFTTNYSASGTLMGSGVLNAYAALTNIKRPFFSLEKVEISEKSGGDGDGIIESGEKTSLLATLRNIGKNASSVKFNLTTTSVDVTINDGGGGSEFGPNKYNEAMAVTFLITPSNVATNQPLSQYFTLKIEADGVKQEISFKIWTGARNLNVTTCSSYISTYKNKIVYMDDRSNNYDIYMYDLGEEKETRLTDNSSDQKHPFIYGNKVVYKDNRNGNWDIYLYDLDTKKETRVVSDSKNQYYPSIYENKISYLHETSENNYQVKVYDLDKKTTKFIEEKVHGTVPPYIHDNMVAYVVYANEEIWLSNVDGASGTRVADYLSGNNFRNGLGIFKNKVVYSDDTSGSYDVYLYDTEQRSRETIASAGQDERYAFISGDRIAYMFDNKSTSNYIYVYDAGVVGTDYDGWKERQIPISNRMARPHLSGTRVIWTSFDDWGVKQQLYLTELDDKSAPSKPKVTDQGDYSSSSQGLTATITSGDYEAKIVKYKWAVSDSTDSSSIKSWYESSISETNTMEESPNFINLALTHNKTYYIHVKAVNKPGLESQAGVSSGILIDTTAPVAESVSDAGSSTADNSMLSFTVKGGDTGNKLDAQSGVKEIKCVITEKNSGGAQTKTGSKNILISDPAITQLKINIYPNEIDSNYKKFKEGYTYYLSVKMVNRAAGASNSVSSDGITVSNGSKTDTTKPSLVIGSISKSTTTKIWNAQLTVTEPDSEITYYSYVISTQRSSPGWPNSGKWKTVTAKSSNGIELGKDKDLNLKKKTTYYLHIKAKNSSGLWSDTVSKSFTVS